ncbi:MAG: tetratricopeptide repeat protein [Chloroflexi bacterium]|nr:tetratricopeptide repeat protein [Chloroflexota bacterium]
MIDPATALAVARAAGAFAGRFAAQWAGDALKRQSIEKAYCDAAEAAINECERRGHHGGSAVWNEMVGLLGNVSKVDRALRQVRQCATGQGSRLFARCSPEARDLVWWFVTCLNERLREELPPKDQVVVDLILAGQAGLADRIDALGRPLRRLSDLGLNRYENRRPTRKLTDTEILSAHAMSIEMVGRESEMEELQRWLDGDAPMSIRVMVGRAGTGKTRLALELCHRAVEMGWETGFLGQESPLKGMLDGLGPWTWDKPALVVVDYAASRAELLKRWLIQLAHAGEPSDPLPMLRVLLLERGADPEGGWWVEAFGRAGVGDAEAVQRLLDPSGPVPVPDLAHALDRRRVLAETIKRAGGGVPVPEPGKDPYFDERLARVEWGAPLFLMMAALLARDVGLGTVLALSRTDLAFRIADREIGRIEALAKTAGMSELEQAATRRFLTHMAAVATLCQGLTQEEAEDAIAAEAATPSFGGQHGTLAIRECLCAALPGRERGVAPILPDMVGEAFVLRVLKDLSERGGHDVVARAAELAFDRVVPFVIRAAQDYTVAGYRLPLSWLDALISKREKDPGALATIHGQLPEDTVALREPALKVSRRLVSMLRRLRTRQYLPYLAWYLIVLAHRLSEAGRNEEALDAANEAVDIYRELTREQPDEFRPYLAKALDSVARGLVALIQWRRALQVEQEVAAIYRELETERPGAFRSSLAMSLTNVAGCLGALGRREEAVSAAEESAAIGRGLAAERPDAYRRGLALSLANLAKFLCEAGRGKEALGMAEEAVRINRELATERPDAFGANLAVSLINVATCLSQSGRKADALARAEEAVETLKQQFLVAPAAFGQWMTAAVQNYVLFCRELRREPDSTLLAPIVKALEELEKGDLGRE